MNNNNNLAKFAISAIVVVTAIAIGALSANSQPPLVRVTQSRALPINVSDNVANDYALRTMARQSKVIKKPQATTPKNYTFQEDVRLSTNQQARNIGYAVLLAVAANGMNNNGNDGFYIDLASVVGIVGLSDNLLTRLKRRENANLKY